MGVLDEEMTMGLIFVDERPSGVQFGSNGVRLQRPRTAGVRRNNLDGHRLRGKMDGRFSRTSALNLRRKLACLPSEQFALYGLTLTMPSQCYKDPADFRKLWNEFTGDVSRRLRGIWGGGYSPDIGFVWRIELTTGENNVGKVRTPHLHLVAWTNAQSDIVQLAADWCSAVERHFKLVRGSLDPNIAAQYTSLETCQAAFQYIANHTSKHKKGQLGWPGRQWGVYYGTKENRARMAPILGRFDNKPVADLQGLNSEQTLIMGHGNTSFVKNCTKNTKGARAWPAQDGMDSGGTSTSDEAWRLARGGSAADSRWISR